MIVNFIDFSTALWPSFGCAGIVLDNDFPWCSQLSFGHEVLSLRRAMNFLRKNADAVGGMVVVGQGEEVEPLTCLARDLIKPIRWVLDSDSEPSQAAAGFNNVLLMFSGTMNPGWKSFDDRITLGIWKAEHLEKGLRIASQLKVPVETPLQVKEPHHCDVTKFQWLWGCSSWEKY